MLNFFRKLRDTEKPNNPAPVVTQSAEQPAAVSQVDAQAVEIKPAKPKKPRPPKKPKVESAAQLSPKDLATQQGEPWVQIISLDIDPTDLSNGSIELDWNDIFVARLVKAGYRGKTDQQIVDQWFTTVCRNIVLETFEQSIADPDRRMVNRRDIGNGRSEFS